MHIALLQDEIYLPSFGGGTKATRFLLEALAARGHDCTVIAPALTSAKRAGPSDGPGFLAEMQRRGIDVRERPGDGFSYRHAGVQVDALLPSDAAHARAAVGRRLRQLAPDCVIVTDDKRRFMLDTALEIAPDHVVQLLQTVVQLPFGPLSVQESPTQAALMQRARLILVISDFLLEYLRREGDLAAHRVALPVYGAGPFDNLARFDGGAVTIINPCDLKGGSIFLALARELPDVPFLAVPTWGTDDAMLDALHALPNVRVRPPADDMTNILAETRVLLVPSLWPETFGYVVPEAMLHGIPVIASDVGGLREAKLGVDYLLPVAPARREGSRYVAPPQDPGRWSSTLRRLISDRETYERCSAASRAAALQFVSSIDVGALESLLESLPRGARSSWPSERARIQS